MKLYVMRHGTTVWNEKGITQGRSKNRLSKNGVELVKNMAIKFKDTQIDFIICSPLTRTVQTANIVNRFHNVKIIKDDLLIEIDQGIFTGKKSSNLSESERKLKFSRSKSAGMETYAECFERAKKFLSTLKQKYDYQNILVVTHNCVATFIEDIITNRKIDFNDKSFIVNFVNAEIKSFNF